MLQFNDIKDKDYSQKGVRLLDTNPEMSAAELKRVFDELHLDVVIPKFNALVALLNGAVKSTIQDSDDEIPTSKAVIDFVSESGGGDMLKTVYDKDDDGVVDDSQKLGGKSLEYFQPKTDDSLKTTSKDVTGALNELCVKVGVNIGPYTIPSGSIEYTITNDSIKENSIITVFASNATEKIMSKASPHGTQADGSLTISFDSTTSADIVIEVIKVEGGI